jgi:thiamine biosynthesis lipoprotein
VSLCGAIDAPLGGDQHCANTNSNNSQTWQDVVDTSEIRLHAFGRACHLVIDNSDDRGAGLLSLCQDELLRLEHKFSAYQPESITSRINQSAGTGHFVPLDAEARSLFVFINALWEESKHIFDPTTRILQDCYRNGAALPASQEQLETMLKLVGWRYLEITDDGAHMANKGMLVDLNSCVRPYALDSLRKLLLTQGVSNAYIEMDQDVATIGKQPGGANWLIGVRIPKASRAAIVRLKVNHKGFAVRGDFEHAVIQNEERFGRALSPVDGQPIPGLLSVAVIAENCLTACSAASIARLKTEATGLKWLEKLGLPWLAVDRQFNCHGPLSPQS